MYAEFCTHHYLPMHFQPWWLDAVCGAGHWQAALAPAGVMPWYRTRRWGLPVVLPPPFTAYGGPWLAETDPAERPAERTARQLRTLETLIGQLPTPVFFRQNLHPTHTNVLPFLRAGYRASVRYTYTLKREQLAAGWAGSLHRDVRRKIRRGAEPQPVTRADDPERLWALYTASFRRKGLGAPRHAAAFHRLYAVLAERRQAEMLVLGNAAVYVVFDDRTASLLLTGLETAAQAPYAMYGLMAAAVDAAAARGLAFDFEGSMDPGVERFYRQFGGTLTPYFVVYKVY